MSQAVGARRVVATANGSEAALGAVRYAAREARRLGVDLEIVHVVPGRDLVSQHVLAGDSQHRHGRSVLKQAEEAAFGVTGDDVEVRCTQLDGNRVEALVDHAEQAAVLVLGEHEASGTRHAWPGTMVEGVSARSVCPVVVVPAGWGGLEPTGRIVVGYKSPKHAAELLIPSFELAQQTGSELRVLHAWKLQPAYDDIVSLGNGRQSWELNMLAEIEPVLAGYRTSYPEVKVRVDVAHDHPAHALVATSATADRLMLVRPAHGSLVHHLGATARAVLREARCPVQVIPPAADGTDTVGLELESRGELLR